MIDFLKHRSGQRVRERVGDWRLAGYGENPEMDISINRPFRFGAIVRRENEDLAFQLTELEDHLNAHIRLEDYTDRLKTIYFIPIILPADQADPDEEECRFEESTGKVLIRKIIPPVDGMQLGDLVKVFLAELEGVSVVPEGLMAAVRNFLRDG